MTAYTQPIIFSISDTTSYPIGGKRIILLCKKIAKDDIKIRFYELKDSIVVWEGYGVLQDVHRQVAIIFRTPKYRHTTIGDPVDVFITIQRRSDGAESDPRPFQYVPDVTFLTNSHNSKNRNITANNEFYDFINHKMTAESNYMNHSIDSMTHWNLSQNTLIHTDPKKRYNNQFYQQNHNIVVRPQMHYNIAPDPHVLRAMANKNYEHFQFPEMHIDTTTYQPQDRGQWQFFNFIGVVPVLNF